MVKLFIWGLRMVELRMFYFTSEYNRYHCVHNIIPAFGGHWTIIHCLPACLPLFAMLIDSSFSNPLHPTLQLWFAASLFLSSFGSFSSFAQLLSLSLCLSVDCELISFEKVMIPLCWDYVCVLHSVMAWLFIACRILIPQLKEWDDTCRELCASCSLTWKNGH